MDLKQICLLACVLLSAGTNAQQLDSLLANDPIVKEFDSLFYSGDSVSILSMLDNILAAAEVPKPESQLAVRLGYNSNVVATSSVFGINQFGLAPGVSYYHKSGLYADVTGYWSNEYDPNYYLTVFSAGYLNSFTSMWSLMAEYSYYGYRQAGEDASVPYRHSLVINNFFEIGKLTIRTDYKPVFRRSNSSPNIAGRRMEH